MYYKYTSNPNRKSYPDKMQMAHFCLGIHTYYLKETAGGFSFFPLTSICLL